MLEQEKRWELIKQGRGHDYHGVAVHPRHLSWFEKVVLKHHHQYQPSCAPLAMLTSSGRMQKSNGEVLNTDVQIAIAVPICPIMK